MDLSILIVNYNTCELTLKALRSVFASKSSFTFEVILIDNASMDNSVLKIFAEYPYVHLIVNNENVGFARANNQGMEVARGRYVLLLNSDTEIQPDTLEIMLTLMENRPEIGASGCKVVLPDGSLDKACKRGFPSPSASFYYFFGLSKLFPKVKVFNQYQLGYLNSDEEYPVDCLVGAFMLVRSTTIQRVGMLDEQFFMYGDDIDWCYRIKEAGLINYYYPRTMILHHKRASWRKKPTKMIYEFHRAMLVFHRKHYWKKHSLVVNTMVVIGISTKFVIEWLKARLF
ncbi:glycosyltransferase family 2 protein [Paenibacillus oryzisoli]|uniref:glycosyltransferase family 2 protein n=1 Tax=Paenibacillus oryzisoli TaxID=1850517 RepID=UPI003D296CA7